GRANFKGGVTLDGSPLPAVDDGSASHDTMEGLPRPVERKIEAAIKPAATDEKYIVEGEIARGGMGVILKAADRDIRRPVAMKVMLDAKSPKDKARFVEEAQVTGQLEHPNIVPIHELGIDAEGRLFFTMKLVKGKSLGDVLKALKKHDPKAEQDYPLGRLLNAFINICNAMAFAHAKGVVHRDLKPANIMLGDYGEVLVMDWGLAKPGAARIRSSGLSSGVKVGEAEHAEEDAGVDSDSRDRELAEAVKSLRQETGGELTMDGTIIGTPHYMPPEQADGKIEEIDARSDIYSLGAMLYEILTLQTPCEGKGIFALIKNVSEGNITPPDQRAPKRNIPKELSAITMKALAQRKEDRYQRVEDLRRDIELFIEGRAVSAKEDTFAESVVKLVKRNKTASVVGGFATAVLLVVLAGSAWINYEARQRAEISEATALSQKERAEDALAERDRSETARRAEQKKSVPAFVDGARQALSLRKFDDAMVQLNAALEYDPDNPDALRLKGQLFVYRQDFSGAKALFDKYLELAPSDSTTRRMAEVVARSVPGKEGCSVELADLFLRQKAHYFAEAFAAKREKLVAAYVQRLDAAWRGMGKRLRIDEFNRLTLDLDAQRQIVDVTPLQGMQLQSLSLRGTVVRNIAALKGMPLMYLNISGTSVTDLQPTAGMPLEELRVGENSFRGAPISDLTPLAGAPLKKLNLDCCQKIRDFTPLSGLPLEELVLNSTFVRDLTFVKGMPLKFLHLWTCRSIGDLNPLSGLNLKGIAMCETAVNDLSPLRGMKLEWFQCVNMPVADLTPLQGMPLRDLSITDCSAVRDIMPLRGMPLEKLYLAGTSVTDLEPLEGTSLVELGFTPRNIKKGIEIIRSMKSLGRIDPANVGPRPAAEFWKRYDAGEFDK
ncbi:MAG: protein kinase, partial [Planctomycetota bacterium]|nr:protein kinase [Planctomycetota bacterium]